MRVLRAMAILFPLLAFAGWRQVGTVAGVQDIQIVDAGVVLVTGNTGATAWHVASDGGLTTVVSLPAPGLLGAGIFGANCLVGVAGNGTVSYSSAACGTAGAINVFSNSVVRFRLLADPPLGLAVLTNGTTSDFLVSGPNPDGGWDNQGAPYALANQGRTLQTARIGGFDYAVVDVGSLAFPAKVRVSVDAGTPFDVTVPATVRDVAPFERNGSPAIMMTALAGGALTLMPDLRTPAMTITATKDAGIAARYVSVSGVTGMATTTAAGTLIAPIPNPVRVAEQWTIRSPPAAAVLFNDRISCLDAWCATVDIATGNIWFYENALPPTVAVSPVVVGDAGQTIRLIADAGDGDGDPIYVSWTTSTGGVFIAPAGVDDGRQVDLSLPVGVCTGTINVTVTDGLPAHDQTIVVPLSSNERGALEATTPPARVLAGDPTPINLSAGIDGGCELASVAWSSSDGQPGGGATFAWIPPLTECNADGGQFTVTATATWASGAPATSSVSSVITVEPWGRPTQPSFASSSGQPSGSTVDYLTNDPQHVCRASNGFPGTELLWNITANAGDAGIQFLDGGLRIIAPATCVPLTVAASAVRQVIGEDAGRVSLAGSLSVDITADTAPLSATTDFFISVQGDGGTLFGILKTDAGCLDERGAHAVITVSSGGAYVTDGGGPISSGAWTLEVPGGCTGGTYDVVADLYDDAGFTGASDFGSITLDFTAAKVGTLSTDRLDVVCGAGARSALTVIRAPNSCGQAELTWRATAGPSLVTTSGTGEMIDLQTEALDFSMVGQQLAFELAADAGAGNFEVATRTLELGVQPFLEITVKAQPPLRREEDAVALEVTLHNTTDCDVEGLSVALPLSGASPVLESALMGGRRVSARLSDEGVVIDGVSVPASGNVKLQLSARARLLSKATVTPVASLSGYVVSTQAPDPPPATGCGCSSAPTIFGLLALIVLLRRRRSAPHPGPLPVAQGEGER